jgi:hypothetical protein
MPRCASQQNWRPMSQMGQRSCEPRCCMTAFPPKPEVHPRSCYVAKVPGRRRWPCSGRGRRRQPVLDGQRDDQLVMNRLRRARCHDQAAVRLARECRHCPFDLGNITHVDLGSAPPQIVAPRPGLRRTGRSGGRPCYPLTSPDG